jgi:hypothetical protein
VDETVVVAAQNMYKQGWRVISSLAIVPTGNDPDAIT